MTSLGSPVRTNPTKAVGPSSKRLTFERAIRRLRVEGPEVQRRLSLLRDSSALGKRAVENIYSESRLTWSAWKRLFSAVLRAPGSPKSIEEAVSAGVRESTLSGPELPYPRPSILGRATTSDRFSWHLFQVGCFATYPVAKRWLSSQIGKSIEGAHRKLGGKPLGNFLMWATFNRETRAADPFFEKPCEAEMLRGLLGLARDSGKPLVLLEYSLPVGKPPLIPTVADAYAGSLTYYFSVLPQNETVSGAKYPTTLPWQEYELYEPRPEVVHDVISGERLVSPLEELL